MDVHGVERNVPELVATHEVTVHHDHARHPEEEDVEAGDQQRGWVEAVELRRVLRPAEARARQQSGGEPGVQNIGVLFELAARALRALRWRFARHNNFAALLAVPRGNAMSPPQLARD